MIKIIIPNVESLLRTSYFCSTTALIPNLLYPKFRRITRPGFATWKKLGIRLLFGYEYQAESGVITWLKLYLNRNFKIQLCISGKKVITRFSIRVRTMIFEWVQIGLVFVLRLNTILGFQYQALTQPRLQTFKAGLKNESRVGTPICRNLKSMKVCLVRKAWQNEIWHWGLTKKDIVGLTLIFTAYVLTHHICM